MNLMFITPFSVCRLTNGGAVRSWNLARQIARWADVTFVNYCLPMDDREALQDDLCRQGGFRRSVLVPVETSQSFRFKKYISWLAGQHSRMENTYCMPRSMKDAIASCIALSRPDALVIESVLMAPILEHISGIPKILSHQNVESLVQSQMAKDAGLIGGLAMRKEAVALRHIERRVIPKFDANCFVSALDLENTRCITGPLQRTAIVPNGVDPEHFAPDARTHDDQPVVLYVGSFNWPPNIQAVDFFLREIWPNVLVQHPQATFRIVGSGIARKKNDWAMLPNVVCIGEVTDIREQYRSATVLAVPLHNGGGTRLKVLEAMACGLPVVSTAKGIEGLDLENGDHYLQADDTVTFANSVCTLLSDRQARLDLAIRARERVLQAYTWDSIGNRLKQLVIEIVSQQGGD